jgi:hypothetical protein
VGWDSVARKHFLAKSPAELRNPQMMGVAQRGSLQFLKMSFWRIIRLLMISASIQKL